MFQVKHGKNTWLLHICALQQAGITDNICLADRAATAAIGQDPLLILSFQKKELKSAGIHYTQNAVLYCRRARLNTFH